MKSMGRMERIVIIISIVIIAVGIAYAGTKTILQLTEETAPTSDDLVHVWEVTGAVSRKVTLSNLGKGITIPNISQIGDITATAGEINVLGGLSGVTAAELSYIGDVTSLIQAQLDLKAPLASPTFTGTITIGSAGVDETELETIDGILASTTQLNYLQSATGTTGTGKLAFENSPQFITPDLGAATGDSLTLDASATPGWVFRDSGNPGTDKEIAKFDANYLSGADGAEDGAWYLRAMLGGSEVVALEWNSDNEQLTMGDSGTGEDLIWDFEEAADNEVGVKTNSGTLQINFGTLHLLTTGTITGAVFISSDADGKTFSTQDVMGGFHLATGAGTWVIPDVCDSASGASFLLYSTTAAAVVINPDDGDVIVLNGTALSAGDSITSASGAGDYIGLVCGATNTWYTLGRSGAWTDTD